MNLSMKTALTIAGSDSSGGAGIQADIKTFSAHGVFGMSVITAVTAQNTQKVIDVQDMTPDIIGKQIDAIFQDIEVDAVKIGMVSQIKSIEIIAEKLNIYKPTNLVLDPVMVSKSGYKLLNPMAIDTLVKEILPLSYVITPNIPEAEEIAGIRIDTFKDMEWAAKRIYDMGPKYVLIKGGHMPGDATDLLYDGKNAKYLEGKRINTKNTHGTGCTLSSAIASNLALGFCIDEAVKKAKDYITLAVKYSLSLGKGVGPTNHFYEFYRKAGIKID